MFIFYYIHFYYKIIKMINNLLLLHNIEVIIINYNKKNIMELPFLLVSKQFLKIVYFVKKKYCEFLILSKNIELVCVKRITNFLLNLFSLF